MSRDLGQRLATAALLIGLFLAILFQAPTWLWSLFLLTFLTGGAWEWAALLRYSTPWRLVYAIATPGLAWLAGASALPTLTATYLPAVLFWLLLVPAWLSRGWPLPGPWAGALVGWLLLLPTYLALVQLRLEGAGIVLAVVGIGVVADSAAYFAGRAFGRHKLAPRISPGKTWEGALGAGLAITLYALLLAQFWPVDRQAPTPAVLIGALWLLFVLSVLGDLFESWIKRQAGVKDSGRLLPGHGGVLDRIDSLTAVLPCAALLWLI